MACLVRMHNKPQLFVRVSEDRLNPSSSESGRWADGRFYSKQTRQELHDPWNDVSRTVYLQWLVES
jgi:hypothetical protein